MTINDIANQMRAKSVEKVRFGDVARHVCWTGGQVGRMTDTPMQHRMSDGTVYGMCNKCRRFFYAVPRKYQASDNHKQFEIAK